jgi:hypothetical protein
MAPVMHQSHQNKVAEALLNWCSAEDGSPRHRGTPAVLRGASKARYCIRGRVGTRILPLCSGTVTQLVAEFMALGRHDDSAQVLGQAAVVHQGRSCVGGVCAPTRTHPDEGHRRYDKGRHEAFGVHGLVDKVLCAKLKQRDSERAHGREVQRWLLHPGRAKDTEHTCYEGPC